MKAWRANECTGACAICAEYSACHERGLHLCWGAAASRKRREEQRIAVLKRFLPTDAIGFEIGVHKGRFTRELLDGLRPAHIGFDLEVMKGLADGSFDWVYLDSSHQYEHTVGRAREPMSTMA